MRIKCAQCVYSLRAIVCLFHFILKVLSDKNAVVFTVAPVFRQSRLQNLNKRVTERIALMDESVAVMIRYSHAVSSKVMHA